MLNSGRPRVAIRVDGGVQPGSGHVVRCLTLAHEMQRHGATVLFICRELSGNLIPRIETEGFRVARLGPGTSHAENQDARESSRVLEQFRPNWLVVDHYALGAAWEHEQRRWTDYVLAIDDLADRQHDCDVLLDQNYFGSATDLRYHGLVPDHCRLLLGPRYALLRREYSLLRSVLLPRTRGILRVIVFFGGTDATDETSKALRALLIPPLTQLHVDVVIGSNHPNPGAVEELASRRPNTVIHCNLPTLCGLMARADLAVGAGGTSTWERLCLGLPSVVVTVATNQDEPTRSLAETGAIRWIGNSSSVDELDIANAVRDAIGAPAQEPFEVDGLGLLRVCAAIVPPRTEELYLQRATPADSRLFLDWRNEAIAREMSFQTSKVTPDAHACWFARKLVSSDVEMFVGKVDDLPVGQARLEYRGEHAQLSYSIDSSVRGLGFGTALVAAVIERAGRIPPAGFIAQVKACNVPSCRIFERLGWQSTSTQTGLEFKLDAVIARAARDPAASPSAHSPPEQIP